MERGNMCCVKWPQTTWPQTTTTFAMCTKMIMGTCSRCGGRVTVPTIWMGINPPDPSCERCGAVCYGPVIDMEPPQVTYVPVMPVYPVERVYKLTDPPEPRGRKVREGRGWS